MKIGLSKNHDGTFRIIGVSGYKRSDITGIFMKIIDDIIRYDNIDNIVIREKYGKRKLIVKYYNNSKRKEQ